ncbi:MAG: 4Fe-4S dicluster domain-containing protein [bacterium]
MASFRRRDFLKMVGLAGSAAASGCSPDSGLKLIPYIFPPKDVIPGKAVWYATTCMECAAGCGVLARNRDGRVVKLEGNPQHPVNAGALCARGQAAVQGLYDPDRIRTPGIRTKHGVLAPLGWEEAERVLVEWLLELTKKGRGEKVVLLSGLLTGSLLDLAGEWTEKLGLGGHLMYEPLSYEPLKKATARIFGLEGIPSYHMQRADLIISFGADFLGTWISPVQYARQFASFRAGEGASRGLFVYVGPRLSQTAACADLWIPVKPSAQRLVALGILLALRQKGLLPGAHPATSLLDSMGNEWSLERICQEAVVEPREILRLAELWAGAKSPLALPSGLECVDPCAEETALLAHLLSSLKPESLKTLDLGRAWSLGKTSSLSQMQSLVQKINTGEVEILIVYGANPAFSLPVEWGLEEAVLEGKLRVVSFTPYHDETNSAASLILPASTSLESWGDWEACPGVRGLVQPVMGSLFETKSLGDILLSLGKKLKGNEVFREESFEEYLKKKWAQIHASKGEEKPFASWWVESLARGGIWEVGEKNNREPGLGQVVARALDIGLSRPGGEREKPFHLIVYPTIQFLDGRAANRPWLQELADPVTQITWGCWVEIHESDASRLGIHKGEMVRLRTKRGAALEVPAYPTQGVAVGTLAVPMGQGHRQMGRYAAEVLGNAWLLLEPDEKGGLVCASGLWLESTGRSQRLANTDGSLSQHNRGLARAVDEAQWVRRLKQNQSPQLRLPLPEAYDAKEDLYPPHRHTHYRWAMVVDLDRCIGCGACVVACNAENNVAIVGRQMVLEGREMHWLRIERYWEENWPFIRFLPMLCQHCDAAPCESVCPVYAPHHSPEGLNNQIYNRCIGTRFCSQNCPYKVRRFNWFTFTRPEPLNYQLNPDVTVRQKGVMEKCSFCVQRIVEAKDKARRESRGVRDGEVIPACVQTCPTGALIFGNLMDKDARVHRLVKDVRAYQVLGHLNTKPAVIYLERVIKAI